MPPQKNVFNFFIMQWFDRAQFSQTFHRSGEYLLEVSVYNLTHFRAKTTDLFAINLANLSFLMQLVRNYSCI